MAKQKITVNGKELTLPTTQLTNIPQSEPRGPVQPTSPRTPLAIVPEEKGSPLVRTIKSKHVYELVRGEIKEEIEKPNNVFTR